MDEEQQPLNRFAITIIRQALEEALIYVSAESRDDAEVAADEIVSEGLIREFAVNEVQYSYFIDDVDPNHEVEPRNSTPPGSPFCWICEKPIAWNGPAADDPSKTDSSLVGLWRHEVANEQQGGEIDP